MDTRDAERAFDSPVFADTTLPEMFAASVERHPEGTAQLYKGGVYDRTLVPGALPAAPRGEFASRTYAEMHETVRALAAGFRDVGIEAGDHVAVVSHTRMEWALTDFALLAAGAVVVSVYPNASTDRARFLLDDADATAAVVEGQDTLDTVLDAADEPLDAVVAMDAVDDRGRDEVTTLGAVHERGTAAFDPDAHDSWLAARDRSALASLIYTSGTTGQPKGVPLTHDNFRANVDQCYRRFGPRPDRDGPAVDESARALSFLPLAHVFERLAGHYMMFAAGAAVAYAESPDTLREDFQTVRPTVGTSVPRVYERLYEAARAEAGETPLGDRIFEWAAGVARAHGRADDPGPWLSLRRRVADALVFRRVRAALGDEVDFLISGGGSLSPDLCALYHGMDLPILEGYGLTETSPVVAANPPDAPRIGTIGPPVVDTEVRVDEAVTAPVDDAGQVGELLVAGPQVAEEYWNRPEATRDAFEADADGTRWFRTGDVVRLRPDDYVEFVERAKQLLTLSTGKNVAPGPIEDAFATEPLVEQVMVLGEDRKFVGALLVPDVAGVRAWADRRDVSLPADDAALCDDERVRERISRVVDRVNEGFEPHERVKQFRLVPEPFSEENELLTPTMKIRRSNVRERYADEIAAMYGE